MTTTAPTAAHTAVPFTFRDLTVHTFATWGVFMAIAMIYSSIAFRSGFFVLGDMPFIGQLASVATAVGIVSLVMTWLGAPFAWLLARLMRQVRPVWLHVLAFGSLGFAAGLVVTFTPFLGGGPIAASGELFAVLVAVVCGICCAFGRWVAHRLRRRREARAQVAKGREEGADA